jgi:hypothetical protein
MTPKAIASDADAVQAIDETLFRLKARPRNGAPVCAALATALNEIVGRFGLDFDPHAFATAPDEIAPPPRPPNIWLRDTDIEVPKQPSATPPLVRYEAIFWAVVLGVSVAMSLGIWRIVMP